MSIIDNSRTLEIVEAAIARTEVGKISLEVKIFSILAFKTELAEIYARTPDSAENEANAAKTKMMFDIMLHIICPNFFAEDMALFNTLQKLYVKDIKDIINGTR